MDLFFTSNGQFAVGQIHKKNLKKEYSNHKIVHQRVFLSQKLEELIENILEVLQSLLPIENAFQR